MDTSPYRDAERALWRHAGLEPIEHRLHLQHNDVTVRVLEVGSGSPTLFIHGGPGAAGSAWAHLAAAMPDTRCLLLDRPGTGLSEPQPLSDPRSVRAQSETLAVDVLDALELDTADLVGSSHGSYVALLTAAAHPERVGRAVHLGCPGFVEGMQLRLFDRLLLLPGMRHLFGSMPANEKGLRQVLRQLGHTTSLDADRIPQAVIDWYVALQRHTPTMRNEFQAYTAMGTFRRGFDPSLTLASSLLRTIAAPTLFVWGADDAYGDATVANDVVRSMPAARLELLPDAGHLCWLDDLDRVAGLVDQHLRGDRDPSSISRVERS